MVIKRRKPAKVFITKGSETYSGKPTVSFGRTPSQINRSGRTFKNLSAAKSFANKKAKSFGKRSFEILVSSGIKKVKVK